MKDFAKEAVNGISVDFVNTTTGELSQCFFQMDRILTVFSLQPQDKSTDDPAAQEAYNVRDVTHVYKGDAEVLVRFPRLTVELAARCVGADMRRADRRLLFSFEDPAERDAFYECMKILKMSMDIERTTARLP